MGGSRLDLALSFSAMSSPLVTLPRPCASCPWQKSAVADDIPTFDLALAESLAKCSPDARGIGPDFGAPLFACHQSTCGEEFACAGWLAVVGARHPGVRYAVYQERLDPRALEPGADWPALHENYPEVLAKLRATLRCETDDA